MNQKVANIRTKFFNNKKIAENYFFMTFLQGAGLLVGLLLYPYLIRVLGKEVYGTYIFILSNIQLFSLFISFGFTFPALKQISLYPKDKVVKETVLSEVFTAKILLLLFSSLLFLIVIRVVPFVQKNAILYLITFSTVLVDILFPQWYFQGIQKMKFVTYVNLTLRLLTIPFIFIFIKSPSDIQKYALITSIFPILGGIFSFFYLQLKENIQIRFVSFSRLKPLFTNALPFFWTSAVESLKTNTVTFIIGVFFNMQEVAIWDLANKIVLIPRTITTSINSALFPNLVNNFNPPRVRKVIKYNRLISITVSLLVIVSGYWAVLVLGGKTMLASYPIAVVLSFSIYTWLVVGAYINIVFVARGKYKFVTISHLLAYLFFILLTMMGLLVCEKIIILAAALVIADLLVGIYCHYIVKKHELL